MMRWAISIVMAVVPVWSLSGCRTADGPGGVALSTTEPNQEGVSEEAAPTASATGDPLHPQVRIRTSLGDIVIEMEVEKAPGAALHFVQYVEKKFYDGTIFHRVIPDSMIQAGAYTPSMDAKSARYSAAVEGPWGHGLPSAKGTIDLVRGEGPAGTGSAEFFINIADNQKLDDGPFGDRFTAFGRVVEGWETVERIRRARVAAHEKYAGGLSSVVPVEPIVIRSIRLTTPFDHERVRELAIAARGGEDPLAAVVARLESETGRKVVTTDSGLRYVDVVIGRGQRPVEGDLMDINYRGTLLNGFEFESTFDKRPVMRQLGLLIPGLREGIATMQEGGRRTIIVPPELAFGASGMPGFIPSDATLVYEVELLAIRGPAQPDDQ